MKKLKNSNKFLILSAAVIISIFLLLPALVSAQEEKSVTELREDIEKMNLTSKDKYFEVEDMWRKTILMLYEMERSNVSSDVKQFVFSVENFLKIFESAYTTSQTGDAAANKESVAKGSDMKKMASQLQEYKNNAKLKDYAQVPIIADDSASVVKRFLNDEGAYFEMKAEYENITPIKIWHLEDAVTAYEESENAEKKNEVNNKSKLISSEFKRDMSNAKMDKRNADLLLNKSYVLKDSQNILDLFSAFISSTEARIKYGDIGKIYIGHNINSTGCSENIKCLHEYYEPFNEIVDKRSQASKISDSLTGTILIYLIIIAATLLVVLYYSSKKLSSYKEDTGDAKLGVELGLDKSGK